MRALSLSPQSCPQLSTTLFGRPCLQFSKCLGHYMKRRTSTKAANNDWMTFLKPSSPSNLEPCGQALLFAGLGSYPHTPHAPTPSSLRIWDEASDALFSPDATIGYQPRGITGIGNIKGGLRSWVEGRSLDNLMKNPDITAAFILTSSIAILASEQEKSGSKSLLPSGTTHLAGHGFIGTLTALVAAGRLDLATGVRLARIYASLPASPPGRSRTHLTTVLSARHFHSLSSPSFSVPPVSLSYTPSDVFLHDSAEVVDCDPDEVPKTPVPAQRRRAMQLILDEIHGLEREWIEHSEEGHEEWAAAGIINSSKVVVVTGTHHAVLQVIERLQQLNLANPVMDVHMPCPYHTKLMNHAVPKFKDVLERCHFVNKPGGPIILDPMTTHPIGRSANVLLPHLTAQLRWRKTLSRLCGTPIPEVGKFLTVGRGAKGLGIMLRGELRGRGQNAAPIVIEEMGVGPRDERLVRALRS
ncbi:hypothetical protein C351_03611 [Cryptococcus neoformans c8]|nr:hypothetical protein C353_01089 [Cryptococcus neoformans var. grubii AD1-83a]OXG62915.1 hypothetical protein C351_03611 [Cryptococcus neoformans var. grubii c8]OXG67108.1 hypothetical protein C354_01099 [Cryptococcus neoformans var. grubii MW-RSA1955]OXG71209.1 hypothetical protein C352_01106 [Cryptococcus neoformans var. grubii CHC193]OXH17203.1 hypothetical protein C369_01075 [Cryptococcus neoformans var. grubii A5-35-17]OXH18839.1 hypothetical protein C370_01079 [Cryptococcus neoformans 